MATPAPATNTEVGHEAGAKANFPPFASETFSSQLLWLAICFGVLYFVMARRALPAVGAVIEARKAKLARDVDEATALQQKADAAAAAQEKSLVEARAEAGKVAQAARDVAAKQSDDNRRQVETELSAKLAEAETRIAGMRASAMANVDRIAEEASAAIVERLIGKPAESSALAEAFAAAKRGS
jgi:F-type H+-transporting ATPase subunit b